MSEQIGSYDAKTKLPEILRRVESGEAFTITNRGKAIADLIPSKERGREQARTAIESILKMKKRPVVNKSLREMKERGRK
jgi:prevent-host-death family protein